MYLVSHIKAVSNFVGSLY